MYQLSESPDVVCARLLKKFTNAMLGEKEQLHGGDETMTDEVFPPATEQPENGNDEELLQKHPKLVGRVLSAVGQVALLQLYHLDVTIFSEMKRRNRIQEEEKEKKGHNNKKTPATNRKTTTPGSGSASRSSKQLPQGTSVESTIADDEMG